MVGCERRTAPASRGRIGIDVSKSNPNVLYAFVDTTRRAVLRARTSGRLRTPDRREPYQGREIIEPTTRRTWRKVSASDDFMTATQEPTAGCSVRSDRSSEREHDHTMGLSLNVSHDAGKTFTTLRGCTATITGSDRSQEFVGVIHVNDGGFYKSTDAGKSWRFAVSAGGSQFYNVALDTTPAWVRLDPGRWQQAGRVDVTKGRDRIPAVEWSEAPGEGSNQAIDPQNPNIVYSHGFYGNFTREDLAVSHAPVRGAQQPGRDRRPGVTAIRPPQEPGGPELRAQWMAPILVSPHDPAAIYAGYQFVLRSINRGDAWQAISKDLSANDPAQMLLKSSNAIPYQTVVSLAESTRSKGLIYAGTDDGHLHVSATGAT